MEMTSEVNLIYQKLLKSVNKFGKVKVEEKKTSIHLINRAAFLGVHPKKKFLDLNIVTSEPIKSERIKKVEQVSANRYHNEVRIENLNQVNTELLDWIKEAYRLLS